MILPSASSNLSSMLLICSPAQLTQAMSLSLGILLPFLTHLFHFLALASCPGCCCPFKILTTSPSKILNNNLTTTSECSKSCLPPNIWQCQGWWRELDFDILVARPPKTWEDTASVRKQSYPIIYHCLTSLQRPLSYVASKARVERLPGPRAWETMKW